jgi:hypothetical protein
MVKVGVLSKADPGGGMTVAEAVSFEADKNEMEGGKKPESRWDVTEVEWIGRAAQGVVEDRGRCTGYLRNPDEASSEWPRRDRPSFVIADEICSGHAAMCDRPLWQRLRMLPGQTAKASQDRGGQLVEKRPRQWQELDGVQFTSTSADGWLETTCGRQPNSRHHLGETREELVAGRWLGAQNGMQEREPQAARRQASLEQMLTMEPETAIRRQTRPGSLAMSREVSERFLVNVCAER